MRTLLLSVSVVLGLSAQDYNQQGVYNNGTWYLHANTSTTQSWALNGFSTTTNTLSFGSSGQIPVAGNWDGTQASGGKRIGVFDSGTWYLDINGNGTWDSGTDRTCYFGASGDQPVVGDWTGTGVDRIGVFRASSGTWYLDLDNDCSYNSTYDAAIAFGAPGDQVVQAPGYYKYGQLVLYRPSNGYWYGALYGSGCNAFYAPFVTAGSCSVSSTSTMFTQGGATVMPAWTSAPYYAIVDPVSGYYGYYASGWWLFYDPGYGWLTAFSYGASSGEIPIIGLDSNMPYPYWPWP